MEELIKLGKLQLGLRAADAKVSNGKKCCILKEVRFKSRLVCKISETTSCAIGC